MIDIATLGALLAVASVALLVGCGAGFYTAAAAADRRERAAREALRRRPRHAPLYDQGAALYDQWPGHLQPTTPSEGEKK